MKKTLIIIFLIAGMNYAYLQNTNKLENIVTIQNATVVEYVTFLAKEGVTKKEMLKSAISTDVVLKEIDGFKYRFISLQENNTWVETVFWESKEHAEKGLAVFIENPKSKAFLNKIKEGSVNIEYSEIL